MKLEPGKYYRTRAGRKVGPCQPRDGTYFWPFIALSPGGMEFLYDENGKSATLIDAHDIIAEWDDASPADPAPLPMPPAQVAVMVKQGAVERAVWSAMIWAAENSHGFDGVPEYTDTGNSFAETEARAAAARIRAALDVGPAPDATRMCVACGRSVPASHGRVDPAPGCPTPEACTLDMTDAEAAQHWRQKYHDLRQKRPSAPDVAALVEALRDIADEALSDEIPEGYGPDLTENAEFHRGFDAALVRVRAAWEGRENG